MNKNTISKYKKEGYDIVVELDDEVEYLVNGSAISDVEKGMENITLTRLIDGQKLSIETGRVLDSLNDRGVVDFLETK